MILEWASVWKKAPSAPQFTVTQRVDKADIRVKFSAEESWSLVGMQASTVTKDNPTMMLNLSHMRCKESFLRHLVIHEFGHALGLEHEHQRSDFWDTIQDFIDMRRMKDDHRFERYRSSSKGKATFGRDYLKTKEKGDCHKSDYDSKSVMHYWFSVDWLKNRDYHRRQGIRSDPKLSGKQKMYLLGIHDRNNNCALEPSSEDIKILEDAYLALTTPAQ